MFSEQDNEDSTIWRHLYIEMDKTVKIVYNLQQ